jgi:hypothetical protein
VCGHRGADVQQTVQESAQPNHRLQPSPQRGLRAGIREIILEHKICQRGVDAHYAPPNHTGTIRNFHLADEGGGSQGALAEGSYGEGEAVAERTPGDSST